MKTLFGVLGVANVLSCIFCIPMYMLTTKAYADSMYGPEQYAEFKAIPYRSSDFQEDVGDFPFALVGIDKLLTYLKYDLLWANDSLIIADFVCLLAYGMVLGYLITLIIKAISLLWAQLFYQKEQLNEKAELQHALQVFRNVLHQEEQLNQQEVELDYPGLISALRVLMQVMDRQEANPDQQEEEVDYQELFRAFDVVRQYIDANREFSIYDDSQNTHDTDINKTITDSVRSLVSDPKPMLTTKQLLILIIKSELPAMTVNRIANNCQDDTVHVVCGLTYAELLAYVWQRICRFENKEEMLKILAQQVSGSEGMCFTGKFNDLLSVLAGFYDDIVIQVSVRAQIGATILAIRDRIKPYDKEVHYEQAQQELLAAGYTREEIRPWLDAVNES